MKPQKLQLPEGDDRLERFESLQEWQDFQEAADCVNALMYADWKFLRKHKIVKRAAVIDHNAATLFLIRCEGVGVIPRQHRQYTPLVRRSWLRDAKAEADRFEIDT